MSELTIWNYGDAYKRYDMNGEIRLEHGTLKVHDIFDEIPQFMYGANALFCDPPCSKSNLNSFYTKAEKEKRTDEFATFANRLFCVIQEIAPEYVFLEAFKSDYAMIEEFLKKNYSKVNVYNSMYYHNAKNRCWIFAASNKELPQLDIDGIDEEDAIEKICKLKEVKCIADPCMGKGLVAYYATIAGKRFVGTELNEKRLAVAVERCTTRKRGRIN
jgi:hypothetical protein